jgi:hypothetical protein
MFAGRAGVYLSGAPFTTLWKPPDLTCKFRLDWKGLTKTNTNLFGPFVSYKKTSLIGTNILTYFASSSATKKKLLFKILTPVANV